jgi:comEA protein
MKNRIKRVAPRLLTMLIIILSMSLLTGLILTVKDDIHAKGGVEFISKEGEENYIFKKIAYISGGVKNPGVYAINEDTRISDLINTSGGLTENADLSFLDEKINLAQKVKDEDHIYIPTLNLIGSENNISESPSTGLININTASLSDLDTLPGVGESTAQLIIDNRPYSSIEDLKNVRGIGDSKFNSIAELITIQ